MRKTLLKTIITLALLAGPGIAGAVGFGGINITSALGQPLDAEIDLTSVSPSEKAALTARLADPDAFKSAGIDYPYTLPKIKFRIETRANGQSYIKLTSDQPVNEPFVSLLVELNWSSGRLLREYTFLLDPPGYDVQQPPAPQVTPIAPVVESASAPVAAPEVAAVPAVVTPVAAASAVEAASQLESEAVTAQPEAAPVIPAPEQAAAEPRPEQPPAVPPAKTAKSAAPAVAATPIVTRRGDTLSAIANKIRPTEVSLERMLVALYRANEEAFDGHNMNRLKTGKIIRVPEAAELERIQQAEALAEVRAQVADWNAYRQKLAAARGAAPEQAPRQEVQGKITSGVIDKAAPAKESGKEVLKLSKGSAPGDQTVAGKGGKQNAANAADEEAVARAKALEEAQQRTALLEKNIKDMQRLAELRAQLAQQASAAAASGVATAAASAAASAVPSAKPKIAVPPPAPVEEPSLLDTLLEDPVYLGGLAAVLLAALGGMILVRRRSGAAVSARAATTETAEAVTGRIAEPVPPSPETGDFTQMGGKETPVVASAASVDEVDPIAEADLYLNFGRDVQAEALLKEALQQDPGNNAIRLKLLTIYVQRKDSKSFYAYANEIKQSGDEPAWQQAAAMGRELEPTNPLYGGAEGASSAAPVAETATPALDFDLGLGAAVPEAAVDTATADTPAAATAIDLSLDFNIAESAPAESEKTVVMSAPPVAPEITLDFDVTGTHSGIGAQQEAAPQAAEPEAMALDFDITGLTSAAPQESPPAIDVPLDTAADSVQALDFDVAGTHPGIAAEQPTAPQASAEPVPALDLDDLIFDITPAENKPAAEPLPAREPESKGDAGLEFTLDIPTEAPSEPIEATVPAKDIGLGGISLDLDDAAPAASETAPVRDEHWQEVATKLDLARAYQEMGDQEGAREILEEVLREGDAEQRATAQELLQQLI